MGGLGHYLEREGLATTSISLLRLHSEKIRPPRALWVPFDLGRPLGAPHDPALQKQVLLAALSLLEAPSGPVLEDLEVAVPDPAPEEEGAACPVAFPAPGEARGDAGDLLAEMTQLESWYSLAQAQRGRSTAGSSGLAPERAADFLLAFLDGGAPPTARPDLSLAWNLKLALEDLKAFYLEAVSVRPDCAGMGAAALNNWFWQETAAAGLIKRVRARLLASADSDDQMVAKLLLVPVGR